MNFTALNYTPEQIELSKEIFEGKIFKLIYAMDVEPSNLYWWDYTRSHNVTVFPENNITSIQELLYMKSMIRDYEIDKSWIIVTKSPFILKCFPKELVEIVTFDSANTPHNIPAVCYNKYGEIISRFHTYLNLNSYGMKSYINTKR